MNISPAFNGYQQTNISKKNSPNFKAIPKADYKILGNPSKITIFQLERSDIGCLKYFTTRMKDFFTKHEITDESRQQVVEEAFNAGIKILGDRKEDKAKVFMAIADKEPCGIIIGNVLKVDKKGGLHYSSRKNHSENETELDWLATWNKKYKGVGKALVNEFFHTLDKDNFGYVYVRSEIPSKSCAVKFYEGMGFKPLTDEHRVIQRKNDNKYLIGNYDALDDLIVPMKATSSRIDEIMAKRSKELSRDAKKFSMSYDLSAKLAIEPSGAKSYNTRPK